MSIDPALLSPVSALLGALIGGGTSLLGAIYTHRSQDRDRRVASEMAKRETVDAEFVMSASNLLLNAYTHDEIALGGDEQRLIGLINRMRLFAPTDVVDGAEAVFRAIVEILLKPSVELRQLAKEALFKSLDPDPLLTFQLHLQGCLGQRVPNRRVNGASNINHCRRRTPMKVLAIGLLAIVAIANGDVTASANELRYNPPEKIILADCDENAIQICRQQWDYRSDICTGSTGATADTCIWLCNQIQALQDCIRLSLT